MFSIKINAPYAQGKVVRTKRQARCCLLCFILFRITCSEYDSLHNYWDKNNKTKENNSNMFICTPIEGISEPTKQLAKQQNMKTVEWDEKALRREGKRKKEGTTWTPHGAYGSAQERPKQT